MFQSEIDITEINSRFYIAGQCWNNRTEVQSERNNTRDFKKYIETKFGRKALLCRLGVNVSILDNELWLKLPEYNINYAYSVSKGINGWLKLDPENIIVMEIKGNIQKFIFTSSCVLKFLKFYMKCNDACKDIIKKRYKNEKQLTKTTVRYMNYFENYDTTKPRSAFESLRLKQIIVMRYPSFVENNAKPFFEVECANQKKQYKDCKMLVDDHYIIVDFEEVYIRGDCVLRLLYVNSYRTYPIFEVHLNTAFYEESLSRFGKDDVIFLLSDLLVNSKISNEFLVDVVFYRGKLEDNSEACIETSTTSCLITLSQHLNRDADHCKLSKLVKEGYSRLYSKLYLQLNYTYEEIIIKIKGMNNKQDSFVNTFGKSQTINTSEMVSPNKINPASNAISNLPEGLGMGGRPFKQPEYLEGYIFSESDIRELELIPDKILEKRAESNEKRKSPFQRRNTGLVQENEPTPSDNRDPSIVARRPLQWQVINDTKSTIFEKTDFMKLKIDTDKFEEWFCEPIVKQNATNFVTKKTIIKDEQRLFLISISLKTLEKKQIDIYDLDEILYSSGSNLTYEDLQNILRILPTPTEMKALEEYIKLNKGKNILKDLNPIEQILMINMASYELRNVIDILMFERKFIDEYEHLEKMLHKIKICYYKVMDNANLRIILKVLLDLGNLVNYKYAKSRTRKKAKGFKILSLEAMSRYTGIKADNKLTTFLFITLSNEKPDVFRIFDELRDLDQIKVESLEPIKENINGYIRDYNKAQSILKSLEGCNQDVYMLKFCIGFAHGKLKYFTDVYKEITLVSSLIKRKFGENEEVGINEILQSVHGFISKLEKEYKIQNL